MHKIYGNLCRGVLNVDAARLGCRDSRFGHSGKGDLNRPSKTLRHVDPKLSSQCCSLGCVLQTRSSKVRDLG